MDIAQALQALDVIDTTAAPHGARAPRGWQEDTPAPSMTAPARLLCQVLNQIGHPLIVVSSEGRLVLCNRFARVLLEDARVVALRNGWVQAAADGDQHELEIALGKAARGLRTLLVLGDPAVAPVQSMAVMPLTESPAGPEPACLLLFSRVAESARLALRLYAARSGLTIAEERVLNGLCAGLRAAEIAREHGVAVSTVRTQIGSLREKTGARGIRDLVAQAMGLPPVSPCWL